MSKNDKVGAEHEVKSGGLLACPFCGAESEKLEDWCYEIEHTETCWILNSGYHCNEMVQFIHGEAECREWNLRQANRVIDGK